MTAIKDSPRNCYSCLTSFALLHRSSRSALDLVSFVRVLGDRSRAPRSELRFQIDRLYRQVPMSVENFETPLLFALESFLVGVHLLLESRFIERFMGHGRILEDNGHAKIPPSVFRSVIARLVHPDLGDASHLHFFFEHRIVILLEQLQKFIRMPPLRLVVILHHKGFFWGWRLRTGDDGQRHGEEQEQHKSARYSNHGTSS